MAIWLWLKIKRLEGQTTGVGPCFHLPGFLFGYLFFSHMAVGPNPNRTPSEHQPIPTKVGFKVGGEFTYPKMVALVLKWLKTWGLMKVSKGQPEIVADIRLLNS